MKENISHFNINVMSFLKLLCLTSSLWTEVSTMMFHQNRKCRISFANPPASFRLDQNCNHVACGSSCGIPCPWSLDCQIHGLILCKVFDLPVGHQCGYDDNNCYIFHKITSCTNGGTLQGDGSCSCPPSFVGPYCQLHAANCHDVLLHNPSSVTGEYTFLTNEDDEINVWCSFQSDKIVTYFSKSAVVKLTTMDMALHYNTKSQVNVVAMETAGSQFVSTLAQTADFSDLDLGIYANEYGVHEKPQNLDLGEYVYLGFVPRSEISLGTFHGYKANGVDKTFRNCDNNRNSYFTFFANPGNASPTGSSGSLGTSEILPHWRTSSTQLENEQRLPPDYFFDTELRFGGCGGFVMSVAWSDIGGLGLGVIYVI